MESEKIFSKDLLNGYWPLFEAEVERIGFRTTIRLEFGLTGRSRQSGWMPCSSTFAPFQTGVRQAGFLALVE